MISGLDCDGNAGNVHFIQPVGLDPDAVGVNQPVQCRKEHFDFGPRFGYVEVVDAALVCERVDLLAVAIEAVGNQFFGLDRKSVV